jgi:DNA-binding NarL/FixJ family response regulator
MTPPLIRVMCVDDHVIVRQGVALIVAREPDMTVVASAATAHEAIVQFRLCQPDVTLMDLRLGASSGITAIQMIRREYPDARFVVLTMYKGDEGIHQALAAGAATYLLKDTLSDDLIRVVREVHTGGPRLGGGPRRNEGLADQTLPVRDGHSLTGHDVLTPQRSLVNSMRNTVALGYRELRTLLPDLSVRIPLRFLGRSTWCARRTRRGQRSDSV